MDVSKLGLGNDDFTEAILEFLKGTKKTYLADLIPSLLSSLPPHFLTVY